MMPNMEINEYPDWQDANKQVCIKLSDGKEITGTLYVFDQFFTGEDEVPIFHVLESSGNSIPFVDAVSWQFKD
jgi:hypothetical protein